MIKVLEFPERFRRLLGELAPALKISGPDPAGELAGKFGLRRYVERLGNGDAEHQKGEWLDRGAKYLKEAREVSKLLNESKIPHFFFKGIGLLGRFYRAEERRLADLDVVIRQTDKSKLLALLHARGYGELDGNAKWAPGHDRPGVTVTPDGSDDNSGRVLLDLHWGLEAPSPVLPQGVLPVPDTVWRSLDTARGFPVPRDEHHAALILHHLVRHDMLHIRGLVDFALLWTALPRTAGAELTAVARHLGVERALRVVGRVLVSDLMLYPLRGVRLGPLDWRDRLAIRRWRIRRWLAWAAVRQQQKKPRHVIISRRRAWRRFLLTDSPHPARLIGEILRPSKEYLRWQWPNVQEGAAWRRHIAIAIRS